MEAGDVIGRDAPSRNCVHLIYNAHMHTIDPKELSVAPVRLLLEDWMLLTAGVFTDEQTDFNTMTVAWGFVGAMWRRPVAITAVRPTRYTLEYLQRYETWTLTAFPERLRPQLEMLGSRSGRDGDKVADSSLTPMRSTRVSAPTFREALLSIECRTIYVSKIDPQSVVDRTLDQLYNNDYHHMYYGEIVAVQVADDHAV